MGAGSAAAQTARAPDVIEIIGHATLMRAGATSANPLYSFAILQPGDRVTTDSRSFVQIRVPNEALVFLSGDATLGVGTNSLTLSWMLHKGSMTVLGWNGRGPVPVTRTPHATVSAERRASSGRVSFTVEVPRAGPRLPRSDRGLLGERRPPRLDERRCPGRRRSRRLRHDRWRRREPDAPTCASSAAASRVPSIGRPHPADDRRRGPMNPNLDT
jgi:hypothetical protein